MYLSRAKVPEQYVNFVDGVIKHLSIISFTKKPIKF